MNKSQLIITLLFGTLLSGCAIKNGEYLGGIVKVNVSEKKENDKSGASGSAITESGTPDLSAQANAQGICTVGCTSKEPTPMEKMEFDILGVDIDTLYNRVKREFDFKSRKERIESNPMVEGYLDHTLDFRYRAMPGVNYLMRSYTEHIYENEETPNTIQVELFKNGVNKVTVSVLFYSGNISDMNGYKSSLKERILSVVKG